MKISHLSLAYGDKIIYDDCGFQIDSGDKVGIVGVNGAGKTTLFKILLGEQTPDNAEIEFGEARLGHLPQEIIIPDDQNDITVWDYIAEGRPVDDLQNQLSAEYEKLAKYPNSEKITARITGLQDLIDSYDIAGFDHELLQIVEKMNLGDLAYTKMCQLSGGQKSKVAFARVLFENAGLLLLDEPTNHLDASTKTYVTNFLRHYSGTVLVISHDVDFLNEVTTKTLFVNKSTHKIKLYRGNYATFRREYAAEKAAAEQRISAEEREIHRLTEFVERAKNAKRANHAIHDRGKSAEKSLAKKIAAHTTREQDYARVEINITPSSQSGRTPLEVQNLCFTYAGGPEIYQDLSFSLDRGEKFLVVGENGAGKSTLLKLIVGSYLETAQPKTTSFSPETASLHPTSGHIIFSQNTTLAYYAQELELLDPRRTVLENVQSYDFTETELRSILNNFLFPGDDVFKKVSVLSPGEKARVALCKTLITRANLIVLDEPTNHFDPETQKIIGENLKNYPGTIIMVSHNPAFVEQVGITRMLIVPPRISDAATKNTNTTDNPRLALIKNYSPELLEYYYYLNSELI